MKVETQRKNDTQETHVRVVYNDNDIRRFTLELEYEIRKAIVQQVTDEFVRLHLQDVVAAIDVQAIANMVLLESAKAINAKLLATDSE